MARIKWGHLLSVIVTVFFIGLLLTKPDIALENAFQSLILCGTNVIPALFPFFVCANLFLSLHVTQYLGSLLRPIMQPLFRIRSEGALAFIMGIISGYPIGAKVTADLVAQGSIPRSQGERMLAFCNNSGPLFLLGAVGSGMLGSPKFGIILYASHFLSSLTVGLTFRSFGKKERDTPASCISQLEPKPFGSLLGDSISGAANTVFVVCGFVMLFQIFLAMLDHLGLIVLVEHIMLRLHLPAELARPIVFGFFEPTNGCRACAQYLAGSPLVCLTMISAIVGWSGISIHLQVAAMIHRAGLRLHYYWAGKLLQGIVAPFYTFLLLIWFGDSADVFSLQITALSGPHTLAISQLLLYSILYFLLSCALFVFLLCALCLVRRKFNKSFN